MEAIWVGSEEVQDNITSLPTDLVNGSKVINWLRMDASGHLVLDKPV